MTTLDLNSPGDPANWGAKEKAAFLELESRINALNVAGGAITPFAYSSAVPGAAVHNNGPKLQAFIDGALTTGVPHRFTAGIWNLESSSGVVHPLLIDGNDALHAKTRIEFDPGAILKVPNAFGRPDVAVNGGAYFTGSSRSGSTVTRTVPTGHGILVGDSIEVYCPDDDYLDGDYEVTAVTATTIVYDQGSTAGTTPDTAHAGWVYTYVSCFKVVNFDLDTTIELINLQFQGPGSGGIDPDAVSPFTPGLGCGPLFSARVETHGLVSNKFYVNALIDGQNGSNTDHFHHYDIKTLSAGWIGLLFRNTLAAGTRDFRFDTGGAGPCQRAGWGVSLGAYLPELTAKDYHWNASPYGILKLGFRNAPLPSGTAGQLFDDAQFDGSTKFEGWGNLAINGQNADWEKCGGSIRLHGCETGHGHTAANHTIHDIVLTAMTRAGTVVSATYSKTCAGATTSTGATKNIVTGLPAGLVTWQDVGAQFNHPNLPTGNWIMAILSTTSILVSQGANSAGGATGYVVPVLQLGDHLAIVDTDDPDDNGAILDKSAIIKTLAGAGPFTLTAETVGDSGTIASTTAVAGVIGCFRGGNLQHIMGHLAFSTQSDPTTRDTATEGYWDFNDIDTGRFVQSRHPNAQAGYSAYPSVNLRNGSAASLRTVFVHGDDEVMLVKVLNDIDAGECTEIGAGGSRRLSTADPAKPRGGEALQPGGTTTSHATGENQTRRPYIWVARKGSFRGSNGWPGIICDPAVATGDLLVEDASAPGPVLPWSAVSAIPGDYRVIGIATGSGASGICPYEIMQGESWRNVP